MKKTIMVALLIVLSISCLAISKKKRARMDSWLGHTKQELVLSWGIPDRASDDGNDGEILLYSRYSGSAYGQTYYTYKIFFVNSDHKVYSWRIEKKSIPPQQIDLHIFKY